MIFYNSFLYVIVISDQKNFIYCHITQVIPMLFESFFPFWNYSTYIEKKFIFFCLFYLFYFFYSTYIKKEYSLLISLTLYIFVKRRISCEIPFAIKQLLSFTKLV